MVAEVTVTVSPMPIVVLVMLMLLADIPTVKPSITIVVPSDFKIRAIAAVPAAVAVPAEIAFNVRIPPDAAGANADALQMHSTN